MTAAVALAVTAGMLAAFNPCGFALLPGYLALFVGQPHSRSGVVARALVVGVSVTVGFVAVFGAVGVGISALSLTLGPWLFVATLVAGAALLVVGVLLLLGHDVTVRTPRARSRVDGSVRGMVAYGVVYATVSLSCTLPVFLSAVASVFTSGAGASFVVGVSAAVAYALAMGLVMTVLAVVVGLLGRAAMARARPWTRHVGRASGVVVTVAAGYVLWYGWVELQLYNGNTVASGPVTAVAEASGAVSRTLTALGAGRLLIVVVVGLVLFVVASVAVRRRSGLPARSAASRRRTH
ncbi:cytochrome c biogenesis CcdA family protein [Phycicoccus sp. Root563]|uniref:cytochrome c biogenesis CcdA family protein n=1 Tax=Phycicoccus sp. Root563 TaxID=1736562 RepID=UPI000A74DB75|nr:cytochrome c biogenesis protein CcdA [Phycicoccus sp. Root563]